MSDQPSRYSFTFESSGIAGDSRFTARAEADQDCDGGWIRYEVHGWITPDGSFASDEVTQVSHDAFLPY